MPQTQEKIGDTLRDGELLQRLPEIERIEDEELREDTLDALRRILPPYFWSAPATRNGYYHNPLTRNKRGLWLHTKMAFTAYERMVRSYVSQGLLTDYEADVGRAAVLLHDALKYGTKYGIDKDTLDNADKLTGQWIRRNTELPDAVAKCVERHQGDWGSGPAPDDHLEQLVHQSDMLASSKNVTLGVLDPHEKLVELYPSVPQARFQ